MAMASSSEIADKWAQNTRSAEGAYKSGIQRTTVNPMEEAAKKKDKWKAGIDEAYNNGKWEAGLRRNPKEFWMDRALKIGASRIGQGVMAAKDKMQQFLDGFLPFLQSAMARVNAMPDTTLQERIAKSVAMQEQLATYRRSK